MLKDNNQSISNIPNPSIKKGSITKKLIEFIEDTLLVFQKQFKGEIDTSEEILNEHLGKTLSFQAKSLPFIFQQETIQKQKKGQNRKVDIGVFKHYADTNPFFTIEAKRLTTTLPNAREKEYVTGNNVEKQSGGIERYKHNTHGTNLKESALVAYVQKENSKHWFNKINNWITQLINGEIESILNWSTNDLLINTCGFKDDRLAIFSSINEKVDSSKIYLKHYFIQIAN